MASSVASLVPVERPVAVRRAAALLAVEGAALTVIGVVDGVATVVGEPDDRVASLGVAVFALAGGLLLLVLGRALARGRGWPRSPAVVLQLLAFPVGIGFAQGGVWVPAVVVLLLAAVTLVHLVLAGPAVAEG